MRSAEWPTLLVAGNGSLYAAVKCCITAGRFLSADGLSIEFEPSFRADDHGRALLALHVLPPPGPLRGGALLGGLGLGAPPLEIKVSVHSRHAKVGAALAARLTGAEPGAPPPSARAVALLALGETAVANAVMAAAHAAHYMAAQRPAARIAVAAHAAAVAKGAEQLMGVRMLVRLQPPSPPPPPQQQQQQQQQQLLPGGLAGGLAGLSLN